MSSTVGLFYNPFAGASTRGGALQRLYGHYSAVLMPRDREYMRQLFATNYPGGEFVDVASDDEWRRRVRSADDVILLYPDPIGFGFGPVERQARSLKRRVAALRFLNGRRRTVVLSPTMRWRLSIRRFVIRFFVFELLTYMPFLLLTVCFAATDRLRRQ